MDEYILNCWADEPGLCFIAKELPNGAVEFEIVVNDTGIILAKATVSHWRLEPLAEFLKRDIF